MNKTEKETAEWLDDTILANCTKYLCLSMNDEGRTFLHADCTLNELITMIIFMAHQNDVIKGGVIRAAKMLQKKGGA